MNTLISLQESGALPTSLKVVDNKEVIPLSKKEEDMTVHGAVVIDNPIWIATADGKSVKDADPDSFIVVVESHEVHGEGFKMTNIGEAEN